jgi:hypothetical protein
LDHRSSCKGYYGQNYASFCKNNSQLSPKPILLSYAGKIFFKLIPPSGWSASSRLIGPTHINSYIDNDIDIPSTENDINVDIHVSANYTNNSVRSGSRGIEDINNATGV